MSLDSRILDYLDRLGPSRASAIADDLDADLLAVQLRLGLMLGSEVAVSAGVWRLLGLPMSTRLSNMAGSVCGVVHGLAAQARAGV